MARTKQTERALSHLNVALRGTGPLVAGLQNHLLGLGTFEEFLPSLPGWPNVTLEDRNKAAAWVGMKKLELGVMAKVSGAQGAPSVEDLQSLAIQTSSLVLTISGDSDDFVPSRFFISALGEFYAASAAHREPSFPSISRTDSWVKSHSWFAPGSGPHQWFTTDARPTTPVPQILTLPADDAAMEVDTPAIAVLPPPILRNSSSGKQQPHPDVQPGPSTLPIPRKRSRSQSLPKTPKYVNSDEEDELEGSSDAEEQHDGRQWKGKEKSKAVTEEPKGKGKEKEMGKARKTMKREPEGATVDRPAKKSRMESEDEGRRYTWPIEDQATRTDLLSCDRCVNVNKPCVRGNRWPCDSCHLQKMFCSRCPANLKKGCFITEDQELWVRISQTVPHERPYGNLPNLPDGLPLSRKKQAHALASGSLTEASAIDENRQPAFAHTPAVPATTPAIPKLPAGPVPAKKAVARKAPAKGPAAPKGTAPKAPRSKRSATALPPPVAVPHQQPENDILTRLENMIAQMLELTLAQQRQQATTADDRLTGLQESVRELMVKMEDQESATAGHAAALERHRMQIESVLKAALQPSSHQAVSSQPTGQSVVPSPPFHNEQDTGPVSIGLQIAPAVESVGIQWEGRACDMDVDPATERSTQAPPPAEEPAPQDLPAAPQDPPSQETGEGGAVSPHSPPEVGEFRLEDYINYPSPLTSLPGQDEEVALEPPADAVVEVLPEPAGPRRSTRKAGC